MISKMAGGKRDVDRDSDGSETISASVPSYLVAQIRGHVGKRAFSEFVTRALKREMVHQARQELLADYAKHTGPIDLERREKLRRLIRG